MDDCLIKLQDLHFSYPEGIRVFSGFNFSLGRGERIGIRGSNGSGKTTLFYLIMGLLKSQQGKVVAWGKERDTEDDFEEVRKRIGFIFQDPDDQLFSPTVEEDIAFAPLNLGKSYGETEKIVNDICRILGILELKKRITFKLSWGQKRLVSLAGVLAMQPEIILLDEPTASIDEEVKEKIAAYFKATDQELIIASHDEEFLRELSTKIYLLKDSQLLLQT